MNTEIYHDVIEKIARDKQTIFNNRISRITNAGNNNNMILISYKDRKGNTTRQRLVEPYKLTNDDFWGYDVNKDCIRRFKTSNIKGIKISKEKYEPKWAVEMQYRKENKNE